MIALRSSGFQDYDVASEAYLTSGRRVRRKGLRNKRKDQDQSNDNFGSRDVESLAWCRLDCQVSIRKLTGLGTIRRVVDTLWQSCGAARPLVPLVDQGF